EDAADFVVGEDAEAVAADDQADFVVAEEVEADDAADFVVAEPADNTKVSEDADFVPSSDPATEADADFVVANEVSAEDDTVHMTAADLANKKRSQARPASTENDQPDSEQPASQPKEPKQGLFGRLFKRKEKKPAGDDTPAAKKPGKGSKASAE